MGNNPNHSCVFCIIGVKYEYLGVFWIILGQKIKNTSLKEEFYKKGYGIMCLTVRNFENNEFFWLLSESKDELGTFTKANKYEQVYATKLGDIEKLHETLQAGLHCSKASQTVASLEASDRERDDALSTLTGLVKAFSHVKEASSKEDYEKLSKIFKNYAGLTNISCEKETEAINHLL